uniref:Uncharacterized protein n=1 Tax=Graphocephala atropunctata TaxID=36148 RepID=A0A1B6LIE4_9HEMI
MMRRLRGSVLVAVRGAVPPRDNLRTELPAPQFMTRGRESFLSLLLVCPRPELLEPVVRTGRSLVRQSPPAACGSGLPPVLVLVLTFPLLSNRYRFQFKKLKR